MDKELYKQLDRLNKRLARFDKQGVENNIVGIIRNELKTFYKNNKIKVDEKKPTNFIKRKTLTPEQEAELKLIADAMEFERSSSIGYYKRHKEETARSEQAYKKAQSEYHFNSYSDYVKYVDKVSTMMKEKTIRNALDSDQIMQLYTYGADIGIPDEEIETVILFNLDKGTDTNQRYDFIQNEIRNYKDYIRDMKDNNISYNDYMKNKKGTQNAYDPLLNK